MGIQLDRVINENYEKLNTVDQHILQFVQANLESCKKMNIADVTVAAFYNAHMFCAACAVTNAVVVPVIIDIVARFRHLCVILTPAPHLLPQLNLAVAATFSRNNIRVACFNGNFTGKGVERKCPVFS